MMRRSRSGSIPRVIELRRGDSTNIGSGSSSGSGNRVVSGAGVGSGVAWGSGPGSRTIMQELGSGSGSGVDIDEERRRVMDEENSGLRRS